MNQQDFVNKYYPIARQVAAGTPIFPETIVTAAGVESGWGESKLARQYNNFFGFTADNTPNVPRVFMCNQAGQDCHYYKVYASVQDSFADYVRLLMSYDRYLPVRQADTVEAQFQALQKAGYATNPNYASILTNVYKQIKSFLTKSPGFDAGLLIALILVAVWYFSSK